MKLRIHHLSTTITRGVSRMWGSLLVTLLLAACNPSDDIEEIFTTHDWSFTGFCYTPNWDSADCSMLHITLSGAEDYQLNTLRLLANGVAEVSMPGCTLTGRWTADGTQRSFTLSALNVSAGSLDSLSPFSAKFYKELTATAWYRGDSTYLQLFDSEGHYYLLFAPKAY